jgi:hypothetical protein
MKHIPDRKLATTRFARSALFVNADPESPKEESLAIWNGVVFILSAKEYGDRNVVSAPEQYAGPGTIAVKLYQLCFGAASLCTPATT